MGGLHTLRPDVDPERSTLPGAAWWRPPGNAAVVKASAGPVIAAGSVVDAMQITTLASAGAWAFTIGGAIFEGRLPGGPDVAAQVRHVRTVAAAISHDWPP
ncbi:MAG TPA: hypothetical protein VF065_04615 [Ilumatobacter sp.]